MDFDAGMNGLAEMELEGLYDSLAGIKEDAMEFGLIALTTVASASVAKLVVEYASDMEMLKGKNWSPYVAGALPIVVGLLAGGYLRRVNNNVAIGTAVGMIGFGLGHIAKSLMGTSSSYVALGGVDGLGYNYGYESGSYLSAAPVSVEDEGMAGLFAAPVSVEDEGMSGLYAAPVSVEDEGMAMLASTF